MPTIYGFFNNRYFVNNPYGCYSWFSTREARDGALAELEAEAAIHSLADPHFPTMAKRIRTERQWDWYDALVSKGYLRANGIDAPDGTADHSWEGL